MDWSAETQILRKEKTQPALMYHNLNYHFYFICLVSGFISVLLHLESNYK